MATAKPFLILQLRPEDETANAEFRTFLLHGGLHPHEVHRVRMDQEVMPTVDLMHTVASLSAAVLGA